MATKLIKPVKREMLSTGLERGKHRNRMKGTRQTYTCYLGHCFRLAQALTLEIMYKERLKRYNEEKKFRSGLRKPKRPMLPFSKIYFEATSAS